MLLQRKTLFTVMVGVVIGLVLGLAIGWWWWPVEWSDTTLGSLRFDLQVDYFLWVADQYQATGDLGWARSKLDADSWEEDQLVETLERLALESGEEEAIRLLVLALALETPTERAMTVPTASSWQLSRPVQLVGLIVLLMAGFAGGTFTLIRRSNKSRYVSNTIPGMERSTRGWLLPNLTWRIGPGIPLIEKTRRLRRFVFNGHNLLAMAIIGLFISVAVAAPWLAPPADPDNPSPFKLVDSSEQVPLAPGPGIPLGTSVFNESPMLLHYDVYHSLIWGTRAALRFGLTVVLISACFGVLVGAISGYIGGVFNNMIMRITDGFLAFPLIAAVWLFQQLMANLERGNYYYGIDSVVAPLTERQRFIAALGLEPVLFAFILFSWMPFARLINANVLRLKHSEYILAAKTISVKHHWIILRHLLPNAIAPVIVLIARDIGYLVILQAAFAFIGIGGNITGNITEWNRLLLLGRSWIIGVGGNLLLYWWLYIPVTLALVLFGVGWNVFGDRLNVLMSPWDEK